jgi:hypothetical protein
VNEVLEFERNLISEALAKVNGRVSYAAKLLGIGKGLLTLLSPDTPNYLNNALRFTVAREKSSHLETYGTPARNEVLVTTISVSKRFRSVSTTQTSFRGVIAEG